MILREKEFIIKISNMILHVFEWILVEVIWQRMIVLAHSNQKLNNNWLLKSRWKYYQVNNNIKDTNIYIYLLFSQLIFSVSLFIIEQRYLDLPNFILRVKIFRLFFLLWWKFSILFSFFLCLKFIIKAVLLFFHKNYKN